MKLQNKQDFNNSSTAEENLNKEISPKKKATKRKSKINKSVSQNSDLK